MNFATHPVLQHEADNSVLRKCWDVYFSGLSASEYAAGNECRKISEEFFKLGHLELSEKYYQFSIEEEDHGRLGAAMGSRRYALTKTANDIFTCKRFEKSDHPLTTRLVIIHSIFEPSALAILGFLNQNADSIFDRTRSNIVKACTSSIIKDEMGHVQDGARLIKELMDDKVLPAFSSSTKDCIRFHYSFVIAGFRSFFKEVPVYKPTIESILDKFDFYVNQSVSLYGFKVR